jgi:NNP family nitrate/nitrite transporter-like MFS transporter
LAAAGLVYVPLVVAAGVCAFLFMDNLSEAKAPITPTLDSVKHADTWLMSFLYVGTFGSFIGYSAAFPTLLRVVFDRGDIALTWGFLGAFVGSVARPLGGRLADRFGGAIISMWTFVAMAAAGFFAVIGVQRQSLLLYFLAFMALFALTGIGNGSTYRMIPSIFGRLGARRGSSSEIRLEFKRQASAAIGIISSMGAFGGAAIPWVYKWSKQTFDGSIVPAMQFYVLLFLVMGAVTWFFYVRRSAEMSRV